MKRLAILNGQLLHSPFNESTCFFSGVRDANDSGAFL